MAVKLGATIYNDLCTRTAAGVESNADSLPVGTLVRNGDDTAETVTVTNKATGVYKVSTQVPSTWSVGDDIQIRVRVIMGGNADNGVIRHDTVTLSPTEHDVVPASRTGILCRTATGMIGEKSITLQVGEAPLIAWDYRQDLSGDDRVGGIDLVAVQSGSGVSVSPVGVLGSQAKVLVTATSAGTAVVRCKVTYANGGTAEGDLTIKVVA